MSAALNRSSLVLGWALMVLSLCLLLLDGAPLRRWGEARWQDWHAARLLRREWDAVAGSASRLAGREDAPIIVEFIDYQCVYCRALHDSLSSDSHPSALTLVLRHAPHPASMLSRHAARYAICARERGLLAVVHHVLLTNDSWVNRGDVTALDSLMSTAVNADLGLGTCAASAAADSAVAADVALAKRLHIRGTPTVAFDDGRLLAGTRALGAVMGRLAGAR